MSIRIHMADGVHSAQAGKHCHAHAAMLRGCVLKKYFLMLTDSMSNPCQKV
jgi:hypothetical protein